MTHREFIENNFKVLASTEKSILFEAYGEVVAEIGGATFDCKTVEDFYQTIEVVGEDFEE